MRRAAVAVLPTMRAEADGLRRAEPGQGARPALDVAIGLLGRHPVTLDDAAHERVALAVDARDVVVREPPPVFARLALEQRPICFDLIPVHRSVLFQMFAQGPPSSWSMILSENRYP